MSEEIMHFAIENPDARRKELLGTVLSYLQSIKEFEMTRILRHEKTKEVTKLVKAVTELKERMKELEAQLPKVDLGPYEKEHHEPEKKESAAHEDADASKISKNIIERNRKLSKLDSEIELLKDRVSSL